MNINLPALIHIAETLVFGSIIVLVSALWLGLLWHMAYKTFSAIFGLVFKPLLAPFKALLAKFHKAKATEPGQAAAVVDAGTTVEEVSDRAEPVMGQEQFLDFEPTDVSQFESSDAVMSEADAAMAAEAIPAPAPAAVSTATAETTVVAVVDTAAPAPVLAPVAVVAESAKKDEKHDSLESRLAQEFDAVQISAAA